MFVNKTRGRSLLAARLAMWFMISFCFLESAAAAGVAVTMIDDGLQLDDTLAILVLVGLIANTPLLALSSLLFVRSEPGKAVDKAKDRKDAHAHHHETDRCPQAQHFDAIADVLVVAEM